MGGLFDLNEVKVSYTSRELLRDTWRLISPYRLRFFLATILRLTGDIVWLYPAFALATIVTYLSTYQAGQSLMPVWIPLMLWTCALVVRAITQYTAKFEGYKIAEQVAIDSTLQTMQHMLLLDMRWHERENSGNKLKRIHNASMALNKLVRLWFDNLIEITVNFIGISIILSTIDSKILVLLLVFISTFYLLSYVLTKRAAAASYKVNRQEEVVEGVLFESINNVRSVKVMGIMDSLQKLLSGSTADLYQKIKTRIFRFQFRGGLLYLWGYGFNIGILAFIIWGIFNGHYELGLLVLFNGYFQRIWTSVSEFSSLTQDFIIAKYSISRMQDILVEPVTIDNDEGKEPVPENWKELRLENVSFSYEDVGVLSDVSFVVRRGERVGVVGLSGAGKSTLFKLLLKEREEYDGTISFDGVSLKQIQRSDYFTHVSAVLQDTEVFNLSLRENIMIARGEEDEAALKKAIEVAHVKDFLNKLPQGIDTVIGEKGVKLSGGERQRLGIARAVYRQPDILLLDEATSHLDLESEEKIRDSLHTFFEEVTAIVIAHRLTTIREMDRIIVMEDGRIIEEGSFEELHALKGRFHELWEMQNL